MSVFPTFDTERRVLAHLPAWRTAEELDRVVAEEIAAGGRSIQHFTLTELRARLESDKHTKVFAHDADHDELHDLIEKLKGAGLVDDQDGKLKQSEAGAKALTESENAPPPATVEQVRAAVGQGSRLVKADFVPGTGEFNQAGGIDREGVQAWRAAHAQDVPAEELDKLEAEAPSRAEGEARTAAESKAAAEAAVTQPAVPTATEADNAA